MYVIVLVVGLVAEEAGLEAELGVLELVAGGEGGRLQGVIVAHKGRD